MIEYLTTHPPVFAVVALIGGYLLGVAQTLWFWRESRENTIYELEKIADELS